jgi:hypothetical protein
VSDRFDALMAELSAELDAIPAAEGDEMIRLSPIERGNRLEVLSDRLATRCVELAAQVQQLSLTLALMEQEDIIRATSKRWTCSRCGNSAASKPDVTHLAQCPFTMIDAGPYWGNSGGTPGTEAVQGQSV